MRALLLDSAPIGDALTAEAADTLEREFCLNGCQVEHIKARDLRVAPCRGCFHCFTKRPGECVIDDDARLVAAKVIASDVFVLITPISFGTYNSVAKGVLDRMIALILPFFVKINGELHHAPRYPRYPTIVGFGTLPAHNEQIEQTFTSLIDRFAINFHSPAHYAHISVGGDDLRSDAKALVARIQPLAEVPK